ncbi:MAG TPA: [Fe-Fe] hydrogenase large subunit C-terminal domain-containing protein [Gemmatimonadaceae bacterium]|nr:[Fe-Fe] hydrogenase large subunit C-terminal domain-containing protein [Gemmatimonadaceae bacterium]
MSGPLLTACSPAPLLSDALACHSVYHAAHVRSSPTQLPVPQTAPSLLIIGSDTVLAASPATAVQLTHACMAAGYDAVVPASWGDELVASRVVARIRERGGPALQCSCPNVAERLSPNADAIQSMLICTVSPVVAAAEYLRALYAPARPTIAFAGACGAGASDPIDTWMSPPELFEMLADRGISLASQPTEFEHLPLDRRRFHSEPGGLPSRASLRQLEPAVGCVEVQDSDFVTTVGQHLLGDEPVLLDVAAALGCACAGAAGATPAVARARVREHEPPRAPSPVVDHAVPIVLDADVTRAQPQRVAVAAGVAPARPTPPSTPPVIPLPPAEPPRRRSPPGMPRPVFGAAPRNSRTDGRALPRAYIARRRSSPRGMKTVEPAPGGPPTAVPLRMRLAWIGGGIITGAALMLLARLLF